MRVIKISDPIGKVFEVRLKSLVWKGLDRRPKIPEWDIVFLSQTSDLAIDAMVAFQVISFGRKDGNDMI
jgi:hypothetical protein